MKLLQNVRIITEKKVINVEYNPKELDKMYEELDAVLNEYGLQIGSSFGDFMHPIRIQINVEEVDE